MPIPSASRRVPAFAVLALCLFSFSGCGDDDDDNPVHPGGGTPSTQLTGTFVGENEGGLMSLAIPLAQADLAPPLGAGPTRVHSVTASAVLSPDVGGVVNLTGVYDEEADSLYLSGQGYTLDGHYDSAGPVPAIVGDYTGPNGAGLFGCAVGGSGTVHVYCGTFVNESQTSTGRLNLVTIGDHVRGLVAFEGEIVAFEGTSTATSTVRTIAVNQELVAGRVLIASGTIDLNTGEAGGNWRIEVIGVVDFGTWDASTCLPGGAGPN